MNSLTWKTVMTSSTKSSWKQWSTPGTDTGPTLLNIFISYPDIRAEYTTRKFSYTFFVVGHYDLEGPNPSNFLILWKLWGVDDVWGDQALIQRDMSSMENWAHRSFMNFKKEKCKVLHLEGILLSISACWHHPAEMQFKEEPGGQQVEQ